MHQSLLESPHLLCIVLDVVPLLLMVYTWFSSQIFFSRGALQMFRKFRLLQLWILCRRWPLEFPVASILFHDRSHQMIPPLGWAFLSSFAILRTRWSWRLVIRSLLNVHLVRICMSSSISLDLHRVQIFVCLSWIHLVLFTFVGRLPDRAWI